MSGLTTGLVRRDLLDLEQRLRDSLYRVLPFEAHAVCFPRQTRSKEPEWLPDEGKLLLPLVRHGELLGVFMARVPDAERVTALLPSLPGIVDLCLENLELYKAGRLDPRSGLATHEVLLERLTQETGAIQSAFAREFGLESGEGSSRGGTLGLIVVRFDGVREVARNISYGFADRLVGKLVEAFSGQLPEQAFGARIGDSAVAVFLPEATRPECENLSAAILRAMEQVRLPDPLIGRQFGVQPHAGYALYPQDMDGTRQRSSEEHGRILLHKAQLAAEVARTRGPGGFQAGRVMGYGRLLLEGGHIRQVMPLSRVLTSLGRSVGAREGQHFSVWSVNYAVKGGSGDESLQPLYKGEIVLLEVRESESVAEILHLGDPAWPLEPDDALTLLQEEQRLSVQNAAPEGQDDGVFHRPDPLTGLLRHGDFLAHLARACSECERFSLALLHVDMARRDGESSGAIQPMTQPEHIMAQVADLARSVCGRKVLGGRFGLNSLIFFHPDLEAEPLRELYEKLCADIASRLGVRAGVGLACWPFLDLRPSDMIEGARKALEYALLLPAPHIGQFGSLALNISADKRHCRGDVFGAIEEYKLALLADEDNVLAWNSLGVCLASLGRHAEARRFFEEAIQRTPDDPALAYNLGAVCQSLHDNEAAAEHFRTCIRLSPSHLYALIRLGQLDEAEERLEEARARFESAAALDTGSPLPYRHLARLALRLGKADLAREHLHQALLRNPRDVAALSLMADLYLDGGEDPELAESLARQSVALRPEYRNGWLVLSRALEVQGRLSDAREALLKAGEL